MAKFMLKFQAESFQNYPKALFAFGLYHFSIVTVLYLAIKALLCSSLILN